MFGVDSFTAIINPPQACILAVGAATPEWVPVIEEEEAMVYEGGFVKRAALNLTLSCDHRVVDGALGAQFLGRVRELLQDPSRMLL